MFQIPKQLPDNYIVETRGKLSQNEYNG